MKKKQLAFVFTDYSRSGLTKIWEVLPVRQMTYPIGMIEWYAPWRRYVLIPQTGSLFDASCLAEVQEFINKQMELRKVYRLRAVKS